MRVHLTVKSSNIKTGPMPVSTTESRSCPDACPLKGKGCYAENPPVLFVWRKVDRGEAGTDWAGFCAQIAALPEGQIWRHNQGGDLPGASNRIDRAKLRALAEANRGRRGFTYTHKPMTAANLAAVREANTAGFTVNLSADTLAEADALAETGLPVVVIQDAPEGERSDTVTPAGRKVATCPAIYRDDVTCASCGLCQRQDRKVIIGFPAHGQGRKRALATVRNQEMGG